MADKKILKAIAVDIVYLQQVPNRSVSHRKRACRKRGNGESHCLFLCPPVNAVLIATMH